MKITKNLKAFAGKYPKLSLLGYNVLQKYWHIKADFTDYNYPKNPDASTISLDKIKDYNKHRAFGPMKRICYAPFTNLHFQMNGDVSACSFNYDYTIGNIHHQTIKEIWFGDKANEFRSTLANFNLDKCLSCKKVLVSENYSSFPPLKYDIHASDKTDYPTQMSFEISNLCNYECIMCNEDFSSLIRKNRAKLPPVKYYYPANFIEQLKEFIPHLTMATFIGGEPLLIKQYFEIWSEILKVNKNCTIHVQTNGSYLPPQFLDMLESGQFEIGISIDSPLKETFELIRINSNFDEVEQNIKSLLNFKNDGKVFLNFNFCPLTVNWKELPQMVEYANNADVALKIVNIETPRHLALQYRSHKYLSEVFDVLNQHHFSIANDSLVVKRNVETFQHFLSSVHFYKEQALKRDAVFTSLKQHSLDELYKILDELIATNLLFKNFSDVDKKVIFDEMYKYIQATIKDNTIATNVLVRIIQGFKEAEHEVDNTTSKDTNVGLVMFKRVVDEFKMLEEELLLPHL